MDDASRLITGYGSFQEATAENAISILEKAIGEASSVLCLRRRTKGEGHKPLRSLPG
jgi:hypothetical protein